MPSPFVYFSSGSISKAKGIEPARRRAVHGDPLQLMAMTDYIREKKRRALRRLAVASSSSLVRKSPFPFILFDETLLMRKVHCETFPFFFTSFFFIVKHFAASSELAGGFAFTECEFSLALCYLLFVVVVVESGNQLREEKMGSCLFFSHVRNAIS